MSYAGEQFRENEFQLAEGKFQQIAVKERSKFEKESTALNLIKPTKRYDGSLPTQAVVSLIVAIRGKSQAAKLAKTSALSNSDVIDRLTQLAADALTDNGENIMACEVLWSPSESGVTLTDRDIIVDYPELSKL